MRVMGVSELPLSDRKRKKPHEEYGGARDWSCRSMERKDYSVRSSLEPPRMDLTMPITSASP